MKSVRATSITLSRSTSRRCSPDLRHATSRQVCSFTSIFAAFHSHQCVPFLTTFVQIESLNSSTLLALRDFCEANSHEVDRHRHKLALGDSVTCCKFCGAEYSQFVFDNSSAQLTCTVCGSHVKHTQSSSAGCAGQALWLLEKRTSCQITELQCRVIACCPAVASPVGPCVDFSLMNKHAWMPVSDSRETPPQFVVAISSHFPRAIAISGCKGQMSFAMNGSYLICNACFKSSSISYRKSDSHSVFLNYFIEKQQWISHFQFHASAYCRQHGAVVNSARRTPALSQSVSYICNSLPSIADFGPKKVYGLCGKCALKLLHVECPFLPAIIAQSNGVASRTNIGSSFRVAFPASWITYTPVGNVDIEFSGDLHGGDDWDAFGMGGFGGRGRRGRGGRGRMWRGGARGGFQGGGFQGAFGGPVNNVGNGRSAEMAPWQTAIRVPIPNDAPSGIVALDVLDMEMCFLSVPPGNAAPFPDRSTPREVDDLASNSSMIVDGVSTAAALSQNEYFGSKSLYILPSFLSSARCFESISNNQKMLSEFISQISISCGSTESALMEIISLCSLANANCADLLSNSLIGELIFSSTAFAVKHWAQTTDLTSSHDVMLCSCVPLSSAIQQLVHGMLMQSSHLRFPFVKCKVKYRPPTTDSQPEREGTVLAWCGLDELEVELDQPMRGSCERIQESWVISTSHPLCSSVPPRACGLLLQSFVFEMQRCILPNTEQVVERCSGISNFLCDVTSDYMLRLSAAAIAVLLAGNSFAIGANVVAQNVHPCATISAFPECHFCEFEVARKESKQIMPKRPVVYPNGPSPPGDCEPHVENILSTRAFFPETVPRMAYSATLCSVQLSDSCREIMRWSLVNVNAADSAWAVFLIPAALRSLDAPDILSRPGTHGLNFGLPDCSLPAAQLEHGHVVTVHVDASQRLAIFIVNNHVVSETPIASEDFPLHLAISGSNSALIRILHEPFMSIPKTLADDVSSQSMSRFFQYHANADPDVGLSLAKCLCWIRKAASSSPNFALDFSIHIPSLCLFFIIRDIAASLSPIASEYFQSLHISNDSIRGIVSPIVPRFSERSEKSPIEISDAIYAQVMKALSTARIQIQDLLSLIDLHKLGKLKQLLFSEVFDECVFPAVHRCIRVYLFEEVQRPSSLQTLSEIFPDTLSTLQGILNAMFTGSEREFLSKKLHLPLHAVVAEAITHHVKCAATRRSWTMKVMDDNFLSDSCCLCEAQDHNGVLIFEIRIHSSLSHDEFAWNGGETNHFLHFTVVHGEQTTRKTVKMKSVLDCEISIAVDPFGVSFTHGQRKVDVEFKAPGLSALIDTVSFPLPHLCSGSEQPVQHVSVHSLAPRWVLNIVLRSIDDIVFGMDTLSVIRNVPRLVLHQFENVGLIPVSCSFFRNSVQFAITKVFRKHLISLNRDPASNQAFSLLIKDCVARALSSLQSRTSVDDSTELWSDFFAIYSALAHGSDTSYLSSHVHSFNTTSLINEWTCLKKNDTSLIVHVSRPYSAVISTLAYPKDEDGRDPLMNQQFHPQSRMQESVTRMCCCVSSLPIGTSIINVKVCSSLLDQASFGLFFSTFKGDCTIGSTPDSWGILCSGAVQHKGDRQNFLSIIPGSVITLVYVSHMGSLSVSVNNEIIHEFFDLPSHSMRFAATLGLSATEATLFEVDFVQSSIFPPIHHEGISSACAALREHSTSLVSHLDTIARIRQFSDDLRVSDNSKRLPLAILLLCAEQMACEHLAQNANLPLDLTPIQCIDAAALLPVFSAKLEAFMKNACGSAEVCSEVLRAVMRSHMLTSATDSPLPTCLADVVVNIAVSQISSFASDDSSDFRSKARTTVIDTVLGFFDFHDDTGILFPHAGSTVSLKPVSNVFPEKSAFSHDFDHSSSFFPCSAEIAAKIETVDMARSIYAFFNEQMPEMLLHIVPNFFVMVILSVKKRFTKSQIKSQIAGTLSMPQPDIERMVVAIESFFRTWVMNDCTIAFSSGSDILGNRQGPQRQPRDMRALYNLPMARDWNGRPLRRGRRIPEGNYDLEKEEIVEFGLPITLRSEWSSCAVAALDVCSVVCSSENFCLVQGPFSRRILHIDEIKIVQGNSSPLCSNIESARAFLSQSNLISSLASAVTQRCLVSLPAQIKARIGKHLQSLAEKSFCALVLSCGLDASRYAIQLASDVQLFEHQVVEDALTAAAHLATVTVSSDASFSSRIPGSSVKIYVLARLLYGIDYLDRNEFRGSSNTLITIFAGIQIIKKFLFRTLSEVKTSRCAFFSLLSFLTFCHLSASPS
jgi:hypothetical protein